MRDLSGIIKAYDVRGIVPDQLDADLAHDIGGAFVQVLSEEGPVAAVVIGHDMRDSGPDLVAAFSDGVREQGADVVRIGLASTDQLYFASGMLDLPGAMFTASHNPARYNGIKLCRVGAAPVGQDSGLRAITERVLAGVAVPDVPFGAITDRDVLAEYAQYLRSLVDVSGIRPLHVVVDAGNGMAGYTAPAVLGESAGLPALPLTIDAMFFDLDGSFPNHEANPIEPENLVDLQKRVRETGADLGLAFDGDADRCFVIDERGEPVSPSTLTALIASRELANHPGAAVIHNLITSRAVPEIVREAGGTPIRTRVGHSFIKATMAEQDAIFGGEHSGHFYFRDFWRADSGMLAALHTIAALGHTPPGTKLSQLLASYARYPMSGEINTAVSDPEVILDRIRTFMASRSEPIEIDELDGVTFTAPHWWCNIRPSNTEPLLRLNVEADDHATMEHIRDEVLTIMRTGVAT